jgi:hypothetical protein
MRCPLGHMVREHVAFDRSNGLPAWLTTIRSGSLKTWRWCRSSVLSRAFRFKSLSRYPERRSLAESLARSNSARRASRFSVSIALDRVVQDAVCSSNLHGSRGARVYHHFPQRRNGRSGHLVEPPHGLGVCGPFRRPIKTLELRLLLPAPECSGTDSNRLSCIFNCALREQGGSSGLLLMGEFCPVTAHLRSPAIIRAEK